MLDHILRGDFSNFQSDLAKATSKIEFWLFATWISLISINLTLVGRLAEHIDETAIQTLTWAVAALWVIRNRHKFKFETTPSAIAVGALLSSWTKLITQINSEND